MVTKKTIPYNPTCTVVIATSTTISSAVDLLGAQLVGVYVPSTFDGTTFTLTVCDTLAGTYTTLIGSDGNAVTLTVAASRYLGLTDAQQAQLRGAKFIKIVCGSAQTTTDTVFTLATIAR